MNPALQPHPRISLGPQGTTAQPGLSPETGTAGWPEGQRLASILR